MKTLWQYVEVLLAAVCIGVYLHSPVAGFATFFILDVLAPEKLD